MVIYEAQFNSGLTYPILSLNEIVSPHKIVINYQNTNYGLICLQRCEVQGLVGEGGLGGRSACRGSL
jgi:hypothetical protein